MTYKIIISLVYLNLGISVSGFTQHSAQVSMRVSVNVIQGSGIEVEYPAITALQKDNSSELGTFVLKGTSDKDISVNTDSKLELKDADGNSFWLDITSTRDSVDGKNDRVIYTGISTQKMLSSSYQGELKTTIAYN